MSVEVEAEYRFFLDEAISEGYQQLQAGEEGLGRGGGHYPAHGGFTLVQRG
jgi:hypothetical protein